MASAAAKGKKKTASAKEARSETKTEAKVATVSGFWTRALVGMLIAIVISLQKDRIVNLIDQIPSSTSTSFSSSSSSSSSETTANREEDADDYNDDVDDGDDDFEQGMEITIRNDWNRAVSVLWESSEDEWVQVINSLKDETRMNTFVGHRFRFTTEGTKDQVGEDFEVTKNVKTYVLPRDAKRKVETDDPCTDRYPKKCPRFAQQGECEINPGWMIVNCPRACDACELLDPKKRCDRNFLNISDEHVWEPGDLDKMFQDIMKDPTLNVEAVSKPPEGPWVLVFYDFLTDEQVEKMLEWGDRLGFERSSDVGQQNERGETTKVISTSRTSSNAWCSHECEEDPVIVSVTEEIERVTKIPRRNYESFQLLNYEIGQYYRQHHDMSNRAAKEAGGPRILTFFLYLNDVEEGGETHFPQVLDGIKVKPKRGSAVLWPSVLDENPLRQDPRTVHAALPVKKGLKRASNHWIHSHDFRKANLYGCTGSFD